MVSSKRLFLLFSVLVLLISHEVAAAGQESMTDGVVDTKYGNQGNGYDHIRGGGYKYPRKGCKYGCCRKYRYKPGCIKCCASAHEAPDAEFEDDVKN